MEWCMVTKYQSHLQWKLVLNGTNGRWLLVEINHALTRSFCWYVMSSKWRQSPCVSMNCCDAKNRVVAIKFKKIVVTFAVDCISVYPDFPYIILYFHIISILYPCYIHVTPIIYDNFITVRRSLPVEDEGGDWHWGSLSYRSSEDGASSPGEIEASEG